MNKGPDNLSVLVFTGQDDRKGGPAFMNSKIAQSLTRKDD